TSSGGVADRGSGRPSSSRGRAFRARPRGSRSRIAMLVLSIWFGVGQPAEELGIEQLGPFLVRVVAGALEDFPPVGSLDVPARSARHLRQDALVERAMQVE